MLCLCGHKLGPMYDKTPFTITWGCSQTNFVIHLFFSLIKVPSVLFSVTLIKVNEKMSDGFAPKQLWSYLTVQKNPLASLKIGYWFSRLVSQSVHPKSYWVKDWCQGKIRQAEIFAIYSNIHIWSGLDIFLGFQISLGFWVHSS